MSTEVTNKVLTIPNLLTLLRLLLLPVYYVLFVVYHNDTAAFIVFILAAGTDFLDGFAARRLGQVSKIGQQFDPLVDRLLIIVGIVGVFVVGRVPLWFLVVLLTRDAVMLILTVYQRLCLKKAFEVIFLGKLTTAFVMIGFCLLILGLPLIPGAHIFESALLPGWGDTSTPLGIWILYGGMLLSVSTAVVYIGRALGYVRKARLARQRNHQSHQSGKLEN